MNSTSAVWERGEEGGKARWKMPIEIGNVAANGCRIKRERESSVIWIFITLLAHVLLLLSTSGLLHMPCGADLHYTMCLSTPYPLPSRGPSHDIQSQVDMAMPIGFIGSVLGAWSLGAQRRQTTWPLIAPPGLGPCPAAFSSCPAPVGTYHSLCIFVIFSAAFSLPLSSLCHQIICCVRLLVKFIGRSRRDSTGVESIALVRQLRDHP